MQHRFTERDTELFYDAEDAHYRSFWDAEGSLHWGLFDQSTGQDFLKACANLNTTMAERAHLDHNSKVLDLGCGNGNTAIWLAKRYGCQVVGIDISGTRIHNARESLKREPEELRARARFEKASATDLPFNDASFTHVWSQATIYHIPDKEKALREAHRVLAPGGLFVFDDLLKPTPDISEMARTYVYDRLLFDTDFSFHSYQDTLREVGFTVLDAQDLSPHLKTSYECLARITREKSGGSDDKYQTLSFAYDQMARAVENHELGWGFYPCQKSGGIL